MFKRLVAVGAAAITAAATMALPATAWFGGCGLRLGRPRLRRLWASAAAASVASASAWDGPFLGLGFGGFGWPILRRLVVSGNGS